VWFGGGESQRTKPVSNTGYSEKAHCTGDSTAEKIEDRVTIGGKHNQNHVENTGEPNFSDH